MALPFACHKGRDKETKGALRAERDLTEYMSPFHGYNGRLGDRHSFICATRPECLPERLGITSYASEYAFLYDIIPANTVSDPIDSGTLLAWQQKEF